MRARYWLLGLILVAATLVAGSRLEARQAEAPESPTAHAAVRDSVIAMMRRADVARVGRAFENTGRFAYHRHTRTEQLDDGGASVAFRAQLFRHTTRAGYRERALVAADSAGAFDFGYFSRLVSTTYADPQQVNPVPSVLPDEPAFLTPRGRDAYRYRFAPDTTVAGRAARVVEVEVLPEHRSRQTIQRARYYLDAATGELAGLDVSRADLALLFKEESRLRVFVARGSSGEPLPHLTSFDTAVAAPLTAPRRFRIANQYTDYLPLGNLPF